MTPAPPGGRRPSLDAYCPVYSSFMSFVRIFPFACVKV
jgi:hypothetical protein